MGTREILTYLKLAAVVVSIAIVLYQRLHSRARSSEALSVKELEASYNLAVQDQSVLLDPDVVPEGLCDLLPLAQKWGIGDDGIRSDMQQKASDEDKKELVESLKGRCLAIDAWLDSFGDRPMSDEAAAFMYMMLGLDEMGIVLVESSFSG